jgi:tRNA A37 threonylcarbamoyladenosine biosynthesis protein TsaE
MCSCHTHITHSLTHTHTHTHIYTALCLIEWPQLLLQQQDTHTYTPLPRIDIHLHALDEDTRACTLTAVGGGWAEEVVKRLEEILKEEGKGGEWNE